MPDDTDINLEAQVKDHDNTKQTIALKVSQDRALIPFMVQNYILKWYAFVELIFQPLP